MVMVAVVFDVVLAVVTVTEAYGPVYGGLSALFPAVKLNEIESAEAQVAPNVRRIGKASIRLRLELSRLIMCKLPI